MNLILVHESVLHQYCTLLDLEWVWEIARCGAVSIGSTAREFSPPHLLIRERQGQKRIPAWWHGSCRGKLAFLPTKTVRGGRESGLVDTLMLEGLGIRLLGW